MAIEQKPTVLYTKAIHLIVDQPAYLTVHNHPSNPLDDDWVVRTSTVLSIDELTGEFETMNTLYKLRD